MEFRKINTRENNLRIYVALMQQCYPGVQKFDLNYLKWLYIDNPDGEVVGYDAFEGERIAAHFACIPTPIILYGKKVLGLLSLNTATHPDFQRKGLLIKLATMTYQLGAQKGFSCVYGVTNAKSTSAFVQKLDNQLVQPLEVKIGFGNFTMDAPIGDIQFKRDWTKESLSWRCSNPKNLIFWKRYDSSIKLYAKSVFRLLPVYTEFHTDISLPLENKKYPLQFLPIKLFIGLIPKSWAQSKRYFSIPDRFKPSPLNFLFKALDPRIGKLDKGAVHFTFVDFDAY